MSVLEIEIAGQNRNHFFPPLGRTLRGELDFSKIAEPQARLAAHKWPQPIPGLRLGLHTKTGEAWIFDPLYEESHTVTREQIEKKWKLGPEKEEFEEVHIPSWIDRMQSAVNAGCARLITGKFPDKLPGKPIKRFLTMDSETFEDQQTSVLKKLTRVIENQAEAQAQQNKIIEKLLLVLGKEK